MAKIPPILLMEKIFYSLLIIILSYFCGFVFPSFYTVFSKEIKTEKKQKTKEFSNKYKQKSQTDIPGIWLIVLQGKEKHYYIY